MVDNKVLPDAAQDLIAAAEIDAQSIAEAFKRDAYRLVAEAYDLGVSHSDVDFAPGNEMLRVAQQTEIQGRQGAADQLFRTAATQWWNMLAPDLETFMVKLPGIWSWAYQKFSLNVEMPDADKRNWQAWALRERAARPLKKLESLMNTRKKTARSAETGRGIGIIRKFMDDQGYDNKTLSEKLKVSERTVSSLLNNGPCHGRHALAKLANLMRVAVDELFAS